MRILSFIPALLLLATLTIAPSIADAQKTGSTEELAATPAMGWNSWNFFAKNVTDKDIRAAADNLIATGMKDASYIYVNIDDSWQGERDANGVLHTNSKFPDMKALADYVHSKGLKIGIYSGPGTKTCGGYAGAFGHEEQDAKMYAEWGIDYLKYDLCSYREDVMYKREPDDKAAQMRLMISAYEKMGKALKATGRPIWFSLCNYGWDATWEWAPAVGGSSWRTTGDIDPRWDRIYTILEQQDGLARYAGPGHWNDLDILEVGNGELTLAENRAHFSMWAMLSSPLLAGNDLPNMKPEIKAILTNKDVIAIDQDRLGHTASRVYVDGEAEIWTRPLAGGAMAIAVLEAGEGRYSSHPFHLNLEKLGLHGPQTGKNLWTGETVTLADKTPIEIGLHDVLLVRIPAK